MSAELAARRIAAAAVLADFRAAEGETNSWRFDWAASCLRLAQHLHLVLQELERAGLMHQPQPDSHVRIDGVGDLAAEDVTTVLSALADGTVYRSQLGDRDDAIAYRALAYRLGDDR